MSVKVFSNWISDHLQWFLLLRSAGILWVLFSLFVISSAYSNDSLDWRRQNFCGINSTYMFLRLHGEECEYENLANEMKPTKGALSLFDLKKSLTERGMHCSIYSTNPQVLPTLPVPFIAHIEFESDQIIDYKERGHFVLVIEVQDDAIRYLDGTTASIHEIDLPVFERMWSSHVLVRDEPFFLNSKLFLISSVVLSGVYLFLWRMQKNNKISG